MLIKPNSSTQRAEERESTRRGHSNSRYDQSGCKSYSRDISGTVYGDIGEGRNTGGMEERDVNTNLEER